MRNVAKKNGAQPIEATMIPEGGPTNTRPTELAADSSANCVAV